jgi:hypothetical protein
MTKQTEPRREAPVVYSDPVDSPYNSAPRIHKPIGNTWPDGTPKSRNNVFNWRTGGTQFAVKMQRSRVTAQHASANVAAGKASTISLIKGRKS